MTLNSFIGRARAAMLSALVLVPVPVIAQTTAFGVQGGVSLGNIHFSSPVVSVSFDNRIGGAVGVFIARDFNRHVGLQIDALYSQKGTRSTDVYWDQYGQGGLKVRLDYVEIACLRVSVTEPPTMSRSESSPVQPSPSRPWTIRCSLGSS